MPKNLEQHFPSWFRKIKYRDVMEWADSQVTHEFGHALGLEHPDTTPDRIALIAKQNIDKGQCFYSIMAYQKDSCPPLEKCYKTHEFFRCKSIFVKKEPGPLDIKNLTFLYTTELNYSALFMQSLSASFQSSVPYNIIHNILDLVLQSYLPKWLSGSIANLPYAVYGYYKGSYFPLAVVPMQLLARHAAKKYHKSSIVKYSSYIGTTMFSLWIVLKELLSETHPTVLAGFIAGFGKIAGSGLAILTAAVITNGLNLLWLSLAAIKYDEKIDKSYYQKRRKSNTKSAKKRKKSSSDRTEEYCRDMMKVKKLIAGLFTESPLLSNYIYEFENRKKTINQIAKKIARFEHGNSLSLGEIASPLYKAIRYNKTFYNVCAFFLCSKKNVYIDSKLLGTEIQRQTIAVYQNIK